MKNKPKFKLRKTAAYGLVSCMFAGLMMSPIVKADNATTDAASNNTTTETQPSTETAPETINVMVRVTDKTTGKSQDFQMIGEEGSALDVPEIIRILYPLNQYHVDYNQQFLPSKTNTLWNITVEKYAEDPYEILPDTIVDVVRTVNVQYPDGTTETVKHVATKYQSHRKVVATGEIENSPWRFPPSTSYWEDFTPKAIEGYTPSITSLPAVGTPESDETVTITYQATQATKLTGTIQFTDEGQVVGTQIIQGKQGEAQNITLQVPQNYTVEQPTQSFTLTQNNQTFSVPVEHQRQDLPNEERDIIRIITLVKPDESFDTYKQVSKQSRSRYFDMVTGEVVVTSAWVIENGWPAFTFPELEGYRIDPKGMEEEELPLENELWSYHYQYIGNKSNENNNTTTEPTEPSTEPTTNQPVTEEPETTVNPSTPEKPVENEMQPSEQPGTEVEQPTTNPTDQPTEIKPSETVETPTDNTSTTPGDSEVEKDTNNNGSKPSEEPNNPVDNGSNTSTETEPNNDTNTESKPTESTKPVENDSKPSEQPSTNTKDDATQPTTPSENKPEVDPKPDGTPVANDPMDKVDEGSNNPIDNGSDKGTNTEPKDDSDKGSSDKENKDNKSDESKQTKDDTSKQSSDNKAKNTSDKKSDKKTETKQNELPKAGSVEDAWLMALGMGSIVAGLGVATKRRKDA